MRRIMVVLTFGGCVLLALLCATALLAAWIGERRELIPAGATDVRIEPRSLISMRATYRMPSNWMLPDLYRYLEDQGWTRDWATERVIERDGMEGPASTFAIFTRQSWFGLAHEVAIVGMAPDRRPGAQIRLIRCFRIQIHMNCI